MIDKTNEAISELVYDKFELQKAYNYAFRTRLGVLLTNYANKNNLKSKPTIPRFLERTNRLDEGLRVAEKMLNELT